MKQYFAIGCMSGTSLDGIDLAYCKYFFKNNKWNFELLVAKTYDFSDDLISSVKKVIEDKPDDYKNLDHSLGDFYAKVINDFIAEFKITKVDFIANHGQTVYHNPAEKITIQLGDGSTIAQKTKFTCINNFRSLDVELGGQGAPLVPVGDFHFFNDYNYCINLGGISNITIQNKAAVLLAFDISPCNVLLNYYAQQLGFKFDKDGHIGRTGKLNDLLLEQLNNYLYYSKKAPKSLDAQHCINEFVPLIDSFDISVEDKLHTIYKHIAQQIKGVILNHQLNYNHEENEKVLLSGGGALNNFLLENIKAALPIEVFVPANEIIEYKEAIIFGLLGVLKLDNSFNCLKVVTGAAENCVGGEIWKP